jgi:sulfur transfer complex TusBCD TusB component (DsrH family)
LKIILIITSPTCQFFVLFPALLNKEEKMSRYLLIESRDPFENRESENFLDLVGKLAESGDQVILFLIQNGVLALRKGSLFTGKIKDLLKENVQIHADRFSVDERAIQERERMEQVTCSNLDEILDIMLEPGMKTIWHS